MNNKGERTRIIVDSIRRGIAFNIGFLALLAGAGLKNETIFLAGTASAFAICVYGLIQQLQKRYAVILVVLSLLVGAAIPAFPFAFMKSRIALLSATMVALFLAFIASSAALSQKTFKDGMRTIIFIIIETGVCYFIGAAISLLQI